MVAIIIICGIIVLLHVQYYLEVIMFLLELSVLEKQYVFEALNTERAKIKRAAVAASNQAVADIYSAQIKEVDNMIHRVANLLEVKK